MLTQPKISVTLFLLLQLFFYDDPLCQKYSWKYYSVADGLPQTQVYELFQDSRGYIWIGTKGGASRFDGIEFENFTIQDGLDFNFVSDIIEAPDGKIFLGTKYGLNYYKQGMIHTVDIDKSNLNSILHIESNDRLLILTKDLKVHCYKDTARAENHKLLNTFKTEKGIHNLFINRRSRIVVYVTDAGNMVLWDGEKMKELPTNRTIRQIHHGNDGDIYGIVNDSLFHYTSNKFSFVTYLPGLSIREINSKNEIYLSDREKHTRLFLYDGKSITQFHQQFNLIIKVLVDDENNLWVGTESGLWRLQNKAFENYLYDADNNFYAWSVTEDKFGNILFASFLKGLMIYDGTSFTEIPLETIFPNAGYQVFYSAHGIDQSQNVLLGTSRGILKYNGHGLDWFFYSPANAILYIYDDPDSDHFLATSAKYGLLELNDEGKAVIHEGRKVREHTGLETCVIRDKYGRIWLSGKQGISIEENGKWRNLPDEQDDVQIGAICMYKDLSGNIWLGGNGGLYMYDYKEVRQVASDIYDHQVGVLDMTDTGELLIGSIKGIGILNTTDFYDGKPHFLRFFDVNNGFLGTECKHNSSFKDSKGNIWVCTSDRVVKINPDELHSNQYAPRIYLNDINVLSEHMEWTPLVEIHDKNFKHSLSSDHSNLRFTYEGISHGAPTGLQYQTRLEGYDDSWSAFSRERYRTYTNLPSGEYTFKVRARSFDGIPSKEIASVDFVLLPSWYERAPVRYGSLIAVILSAAFLGYLVSEGQRRRKLLAEQNERRIAKLQFKALKGMIDPHFTFNAINSIASMVYVNDREEAYRFFTKFSKLIRLAFDTSENTTRNIRDELSFVSNYLEIEKLRFKDRFDYRIDVDPKVNHDWQIPKMIIQIYVENSIKHGLINKKSDGLIDIKLITENNCLNIYVTDNGCGRDSQISIRERQQSLGRGTQIMKDYFKLLNRFNEQKITIMTSDLKDQNGSPIGTKVKISIPLNYKYNL